MGWAIAPAPITARIRKVHDFFTVGAPTPFQHAAVTALSSSEDYYIGLAAHYREARDYLLTVLRDCGFEPYAPGGAYYMIAGVGDLQRRLGCADDVAFAQRLIKTAKVATAPGSAFYADPARGRHWVRFCFCKRWGTLHAVAAALREAPAR